MRKTLIIAILALFGSETLAQHGFRPLTRPGNPPPFNPNAGRPVLLDAEDNEMVAMRPPLGQGPLINRPVPTHAFDDVEDNEMALNLNSQGAVRDAVRLYNNDYRVKVGGFDDAQDDELFAEDDELFTQGDMGRMGGFLGNGNSGLIAGGGSTRGGISWGGAGQYAHNIGKNTQIIGGASLGHAPGSRVSVNPHVGVKFSFDDAQDDELFAEDDELFTQGDMGRMSNFFEPRQHPVIAQGGSVQGQGARLNLGVDAQFAKNIGKNLDVVYGGRVGHAPGSRVSIEPFAGIRKSF